MNNFKVGDYVYLENVRETIKLSNKITVVVANSTPKNDIRLATDEEKKQYQIKQGERI